MEIDKELYDKLVFLGIIDNTKTRSYNVGKSDYSKQIIQPWTVWLSYPNLTSWDHDIIKRVLREKEGESRKMDYEKIIHICNERIRQIDNDESGVDIDLLKKIKKSLNEQLD